MYSRFPLIRPLLGAAPFFESGAPEKTFMFYRFGTGCLFCWRALMKNVVGARKNLIGPAMIHTKKSRRISTKTRTNVQTYKRTNVQTYLHQVAEQGSFSSSIAIDAQCDFRSLKTSPSFSEPIPLLDVIIFAQNWHSISCFAHSW